MMSAPSIICANFAQNAWKKDLCSNCFKSEVEHNDWLAQTPNPSATAPAVDPQPHHQPNHNHLNATNEELNGNHRTVQQNVLTNQSTIKPLLNKNQINVTQISNTTTSNQSHQKLVTNDCQSLKPSAGNHKKVIPNTNSMGNTIVTNNNHNHNSNSSNNCNNNPSNPQIVMNNTKIKLNSATHVSAHNSQVINGINNNNSSNNNHHKSTKDNVRQYSSSGNINTSSGNTSAGNSSNNNCSENFRKIIIHSNASPVSGVDDKKESNNNINNTCPDVKSKTLAFNSNNCITNAKETKIFPQQPVNHDQKQHQNITAQQIQRQKSVANINNSNHIHQNQRNSGLATDQVVNNSSSGSASVATSAAQQQPTTTTNGTRRMPSTGILKCNRIDEEVIQFRPKKNKCLVFKEGDPQVIRAEDTSYEDYSSDDEDDDDDQSDHDYEDDTLYTSDDKELRELTHKNTLFNANYNNFSHINDNCGPNKKAVGQTPATKPVIEIREYGSTTATTTSGPNRAVHYHNSHTTNGSITTNGKAVDNQKPAPIVANNTAVVQTIIPEVCDKLADIALTIDDTNDDHCLNSNISDDNNSTGSDGSSDGNDREPHTQSPDSGNCDNTPMSTSSDSYSSGDEKDDNTQHQKLQQHQQKRVDFSAQVIQHLRVDSESDTLSTNSESSDASEPTKPVANYRPEFKCKPQLPAKPNISSIMNTAAAKPQAIPITITVKSNAEDNNDYHHNDQKSQHLNLHLNQDNGNNHNKAHLVFDNHEVVVVVNTSGQESPTTGVAAEHIYQEIGGDSGEDQSGMSGKFSTTSSSDDNHHSLDGRATPQEHRDLKLAELAQELEQCRYMKRPAPQPPATARHHKSGDHTVIGGNTDVELKKPIVNKPEPKRPQSPSTTTTATTAAATAVATTPAAPPKQRFSSIRKLLHKKSHSDKHPDTRTKDIIASDSQSGVTVTDSSTVSGADRKAWKQSEFDRTTLTIVHPIDMTPVGGQTPDEPVYNTVVNDVYAVQRPEAPPRTPRANRPSVPARRRNKSSPNIHQTVSAAPHRDPPPPIPPTVVLSAQKPLQKCISLPIDGHETAAIGPTRIPVPGVELTAQNTLNDAYKQLAKSNLSNLLAIKSKVESIGTTQTYRWTDFEVTNAERLGSVLVYKDCVVSDTRLSVNLMVLSDCYTAPIVNQFRHHEELVLVMDHQWTKYYLLDELTETSMVQFDEKQINSLILQLYSTLEYFEQNGCDRLPATTITTITICASNDDILLVVPTGADHKYVSDSTGALTLAPHVSLHQFLSEILAKLLSNSLFVSVGHVLSQPTVPIGCSKIIVQLLAFHIPVREVSGAAEVANGAAGGDTDQRIDYWLDINRSKFINQFCCLNDHKLLTQLDYIYLKFLCDSTVELIRDSISYMVDTKQ